MSRRERALNLELLVSQQGQATLAFHKLQLYGRWLVEIVYNSDVHAEARQAGQGGQEGGDRQEGWHRFFSFSFPSQEGA